jgi:hypothetical protein
MKVFNGINHLDNSKFYLNFTQVGKIIVVDEKKYFQCKSDGWTVLISIKDKYPSINIDELATDKFACWKIIPTCESSGTIVSYHLVELVSDIALDFQDVFTIQARMKGISRHGLIEFLIRNKGESNIITYVQNNEKYLVKQNSIYRVDGYRDNDRLYMLVCTEIDESNIQKNQHQELTPTVKQKSGEGDNNKYAEIVQATADGILIYIPASQIELEQWHQDVNNKYRLVALPNVIKITNKPINVDEHSMPTSNNTPKICEHCIFNVDSLCSQIDSPMFSSAVKNESTCNQCCV